MKKDATAGLTGKTTAGRAATSKKNISIKAKLGDEEPATDTAVLEEPAPIITPTLADLPQNMNLPKQEEEKKQEEKAPEQKPAEQKQDEVKKEVAPAAVKAVTTVAPFNFPEKVLLKPISLGRNRLGLENTKEGFLRMPGTKFTWEPTMVGKLHKTGLWRLTDEEVKRLELQLGQSLDFDFYSELSYRMDASNPNGHHMSLERAHEKVVYLAMLDSHLIAQGLHEKQNGKKPQAEWYMENLEAEAELLSREKDLFTEMFSAYNAFSERKRMAAAKILEVPVRGLPPKVADNLLWKKLSAKEIGYQKLWQRFIDISKWSDEKINVFEEVADGIAGNIIRKNSAQDFIYGDDVLGSTRDQVISKLLMNENAGLRQSIRAKLSVR